MTKRVKTKAPKIKSFLVGFGGGGMFPSAEARAGGERMCSIATLVYGIDATAYRSKFVHLAGRYLDDLNYDDKNNPAGLKDEAYKLENAVAQLQISLAGSSPTILTMIHMRVDGIAVSQSESTLASLKNHLLAVQHTLSKYRKSSSANTSSKNLCRSLMNICAQLKKKPFANSPKAKLDDLNNETGRFQYEDPQFVLNLAHALDPWIGFAQIRAELTKMPKSQEIKEEWWDSP